MDIVWHSLLLWLESFGPCVRRNIERYQGGKYKNLVEKGIALNLIEIVDKNIEGEDLYYISDLGKSFLDRKINIKELLEETEK